MQELNMVEVDEVSGGFIFVVVPAWVAVSTIVTELVIIAAIASKK